MAWNDYNGDTPEVLTWQERYDHAYSMRKFRPALKFGEVIRVGRDHGAETLDKALQQAETAIAVGSGNIMITLNGNETYELHRTYAFSQHAYITILTGAEFSTNATIKFTNNDGGNNNLGFYIQGAQVTFKNVDVDFTENRSGYVFFIDYGRTLFEGCNISSKSNDYALIGYTCDIWMKDCKWTGHGYGIWADYAAKVRMDANTAANFSGPFAYTLNEIQYDGGFITDLTKPLVLKA